MTHLLSFAPVLYSSQFQDLLRFTRNFSTLNSSFRKQQSTEGGGREEEKGLNLFHHLFWRDCFDSSNVSGLSHKRVVFLLFIDSMLLLALT
jgi:hypothetical protein